MKSKKRRGVFIRTHETTETYKNHLGEDCAMWAYSPTDTPQGRFTSEDQAISAAMYEHGSIRTKYTEREERERERREKYNKENRREDNDRPRRERRDARPH